MRRLFLCLCVCFLFGCDTGTSLRLFEKQKHWMEDETRLKILCTTRMIEDLVAKVGGEYVNTLSLITGEIDPHSYQLVKGDDEKLLRADWIFANGLGLEHGPSLRTYLSMSNKCTFLGDVWADKYPERLLIIEGGVDPHIWQDVSIWMEGIDVIVEVLQKMLPQHADVFRLNGDAFAKELAELHKKIQKELHSLPQELRYLVTSHDAFNYFCRAYLALEEEIDSSEWEKRCVAPEGLAPDSQMSSSEIRQIIQYMKKHQIHVLFPESNVSQNSIKKLQSAGRESGLSLEIVNEVLFGDAMGEEGTREGTYIGMIEHNVQVIVKALKGEK